MEPLYTLLHAKELGILSPNIVYDNVPVTLRFTASVIWLTFNDFDFTKTKESEQQSERLKFTQVASNFDSTESEEFSSRGHLALRRRIATIKWLRPFVAGQTEVRIETDKQQGFLPPQTSTQQNTIVRTFISIPICFIIYLIATIISASSSARQIINEKCENGVLIPNILLEKLRSIRQSDCNDFFVTPAIEPLSDAILDFLGYKNTILDFTWLCSKAGIEAIFDLFELLKESPNNYIKFSEFNKSIPFYSGQTTTEGSISITQITRFNKSTRSITNIAQLLPGNSFGKTINAVQVNDAFAIPRTIFDANEKQVPLNGYSVQLTSNLNDQRITSYVIQRSTGRIQNDGLPSFKKGRSSSIMDVENPSTKVDTPSNDNGLSISIEDFKGSKFTSAHATALVTLILQLFSNMNQVRNILWMLNCIYNPTRLRTKIRYSTAKS